MGRPGAKLKEWRNMRNKIAIAVVFFSVMALMTGLAAAQNSINVNPGTINIDAGRTATQTVTVAAANGTITSLKVSGAGFNITDKFTVKIDGVETTSVSGSWASPKVFTVTFADGKGESDKDFTINYEATFSDGNKVTKNAKIQTDIVVKPTPTAAPISVPEFPTLALPIATVMGLIFLFQYRREKDNKNK